MSFVAPVSRLTIAVALGFTTVVLAAPQAEARRKPAPITYAPQGDQPTATRPDARTANAGAPSAPTGKRIEFRYPDRPDMVYSDGNARALDDAAPMAFSSSKSAVAPETARQYAHTRPPMAASRVPASDPAISGGGFDARATAARIAAQDKAAAAAAPPPPSASAPALAAAGTYSVRGAQVTPQGGAAYDETGIASWYGPGFHGNPTANGEIFDQEAMTAAHPTLPLPSLVQVINLENNREVVLRVNDRGPFIEGRMIDVSRRAAEMLGFETAGQAKVRVRYLGPAPVAGAPYKSATPTAPASQDRTPAPRQIALEDVPARLNRAPAPGEPGHFVQLGSFADIANAQRLTASLDATMPVDIKQARVNGADYFRVWVGPFASRTRAETVRSELSMRGIADGIVLNRPNL